MRARQGSVRVHQHDQTVTLQIEGQATMQHSPSLRQFAEQCLTNGTTALCVDLRHCTHMDSTFLGTLLFLKRLVERRAAGTFALISPSPRCCELLQQMGLAKIFPVVDQEELAARVWGALPSGPEDMAAFKRNVVQAHQELGRIEGPAAETFRELADQLAREFATENPAPEQDKK
jgi:anti-anti-sigma factor